MVLNLRPKCANPNCAAAFEWLGGGRLFRFYRYSGKLIPTGEIGRETDCSHEVGHFWLCERCSNIYTLRFKKDRGVFIVPLRRVLPAAKNSMHLPAS
jgi:hypothetical protein